MVERFEYKRATMEDIDECHILLNWILKVISWLANRNIVMWRKNLRASSVRIRSNTVLSMEGL